MYRKAQMMLLGAQYCIQHTDDEESTLAWQCQCLSRQCELVVCRHLIGDAGLLHILQHGMHGYIRAQHLVQ